MHRYSDHAQRLSGIRCRLAVLFAAVAVPSFGCGDSDRPKTISTKGIVTYRDQPVEGAQVMFTSAGARPGTATTNAEGRFELTTFETGDGAVEGEHHVTITKTERVPGEDPNNPYPRMRNLLPTKYANPRKSPLRATISADAPSERKFVLTD